MELAGGVGEKETWILAFLRRLPIFRIDDSLDALACSQYFSTLDLTSGYWQVPLDQDVKEKLAFVTR